MYVNPAGAPFRALREEEEEEEGPGRGVLCDRSVRDARRARIRDDIYGVGERDLGFRGRVKYVCS